MDLTLTEEQQLIQATAREMLAARCPPSHVRAMADDPAGYSDELWKEMVELGWTGMGLPEAYGGMGAGFLELCLLVSELGRFQVPSPFVPTVVHGALPIARFGTDEQKDTYLKPIAAGEKIMSYTGASVWGGGARPTAVPDGDAHVLDGTADFVPYAHMADHLLVATDEGVFVVDIDLDGVRCERLDTVGPGHLHRVELDGVRGEPLEGDVARAITLWGTAAACAEMVGGAERVLEMTVTYAQGRTQFGRPIGSFQAVQHHCANMAMDVLGSRFVAFEAIWRLDEGLEASEEVSAAKAWVSEAYRRVCALGHQVHGAIGFTREFDLHLYTRHAMGAELTFGDTDHHLERVAQHLGI